MSWFTKKQKAEAPRYHSKPPRRKIVAYYDAVESKNDNGGDIRRPAYIEM